MSFSHNSNFASSNLLADDGFELPGSLLEMSTIDGDELATLAGMEGTGSAPQSAQGDRSASAPRPMHQSDLQQNYTNACNTITHLRQRLIRRTRIIDELRKYYLRDVIVMKNVLRTVLTEPERELAWKEYDSILPSLDFNQSLRLHAPYGYEFQIAPCEACGGQLELIKRDTDEVDVLKKKLRDCRERENKWREKLATLDAQLEDALKDKAESTKSHNEEKRVLYGELKRLNDEILKVREDSQRTLAHAKKMRDETEEYKSQNADLINAANKLKEVEQEYDTLKANYGSSQDEIKKLKAIEKQHQKELQTLHHELKELKENEERMTQDLNFTKQENKQLSSSLDRVKETCKELESNLEVSNKEILSLKKRISELEDDAENAEDNHRREIEGYERQIDQLRHELREGQKHTKSKDKDHVKLLQEIEVFKATIDELTEVNKNQELELLDNAEEIQLFEQEIAAMQQFIREKVIAANPVIAQESEVEPLSSDSAVADILKLFEKEFGDDATAQDEKSADDATVESVDASVASGPKPLSKRRQQLKKQRTLRTKEKSSRNLLERPKRKTVHIVDDNSSIESGELGRQHSFQSLDSMENTVDSTTEENPTLDDTEDLEDEGEENGDEHEEVHGDDDDGEEAGNLAVSVDTKEKKGKKPAATKQKKKPPAANKKPDKKKSTDSDHDKVKVSKESKHAPQQPKLPPKRKVALKRDSYKPPATLATGSSDVEDHQDIEQASPMVSARIDETLHEETDSKPPSSRGERKTPDTLDRSKSPENTEVERVNTPDAMERVKTPDIKERSKTPDASEHGSAAGKHRDRAASKLPSNAPQMHKRNKERRITSAPEAAKKIASTRSSFEAMQALDPSISLEEFGVDEDELAEAEEEREALAETQLGAIEETEEVSHDGTEEQKEEPVAAKSKAKKSASPSKAKAEQSSAPKKKEMKVKETKEVKEKEHAAKRSSSPEKKHEKSPVKKQAEASAARPRSKESHRSSSPPKKKREVVEEEEEEDYDPHAGEDVETHELVAIEEAGEEEEKEEPAIPTVQLLLEANQPKEMFGIPNEKAVLKKMESIRRKSIPTNFNFNPHQIIPLDEDPVAELKQRKAENKASEEVSKENDISEEHAAATAIESHEESEIMEFEKFDSEVPPSLEAVEVVEKDNEALQAEDVIQTSDTVNAGKTLEAGEGSSKKVKKEEKTKKSFSLTKDESSGTHSRPKTPKTESLQHEDALNKELAQATHHTIESAKSRLKEIRGLFDSVQHPQVKTKKTPVKQAAKEKEVVTVTVYKEREPEKEKTVKLKPPPEDASHVELKLRESLLAEMKATPNISPNQVNAIMNCCSDFIHRFCGTMNESLDALWEGLIMNKQSLDNSQKALAVFNGMISCQAEGTSTAQLAEIVARLVPLAGSNHNPHFTQTWAESCHISHEVLQDLTPVIVNYDTNERRTKLYTEFFQKSEGNEEVDLYGYQAKVSIALDTAKKMSRHVAEVSEQLTDDLVEILRDWSNAKGVFLDLENRLENEREKVRKQQETKLAAVAKELNKQTQLYEKALEKVKDLEKRMKALQKSEDELKETQTKLEEAEHRLAEAIRELAEINKEMNVTKGMNIHQTHKIESLEEIIANCKDDIDKYKTELGLLTERANKLDGSLRLMTAERNRLQENVDTMNEKESNRLNNLHTIEIQYEPDNDTQNIQTEFLIPPMDLKTVVSNKLTNSNVIRYPTVYAHTLEYLPPSSANRTIHSANSGTLGESSAFNNLGEGPLYIGRVVLPSIISEGSFANDTWSLNSGMNASRASSQGNPLLISSNAMTGRTELSRGDSAMSTDSYNFNASDLLHQTPPVIDYEYNRTLKSAQERALAELTGNSIYSSNMSIDNESSIASVSSFGMTKQRYQKHQVNRQSVPNASHINNLTLNVKQAPSSHHANALLTHINTHHNATTSSGVHKPSYYNSNHPPVMRNNHESTSQKQAAINAQNNTNIASNGGSSNSVSNVEKTLSFHLPTLSHNNMSSGNMETINETNTSSPEMFGSFIDSVNAAQGNNSSGNNNSDMIINIPNESPQLNLNTPDSHNFHILYKNNSTLENLSKPNSPPDDLNRNEKSEKLQNLQNNAFNINNKHNNIHLLNQIDYHHQKIINGIVINNNNSSNNNKQFNLISQNLKNTIKKETNLQNLKIDNLNNNSLQQINSIESIKKGKIGNILNQYKFDTTTTNNNNNLNSQSIDFGMLKSNSNNLNQSNNQKLSKSGLNTLSTTALPNYNVSANTLTKMRKELLN